MVMVMVMVVKCKHRHIYWFISGEDGMVVKCQHYIPDIYRYSRVGAVAVCANTPLQSTMWQCCNCLQGGYIISDSVPKNSYCETSWLVYKISISLYLYIYISNFLKK